MPRGGSKPGERRGGRKKGSPNKRTQATVEAAEAGGAMPLPALLRIMRFWLGQVDAELAKGKGANKPILHHALDQVRISATGAAPYLHAKLKAQVQVPLADTARRDEAQQARAALQNLVDRIVATRDESGSNPTSH